MHDQTYSPLQKLAWFQNYAAATLAKKGFLTRRLLWGTLSLLLTGIGLWALWPARSDQEAPDSQPILVASDYIPAFSVLKENAASLKNYPRDMVPPGALQSIQEIMGNQGQALYASLVAIPAGQPLTRSLLSEISKGHALSAVLSSGQVAVSFAVDKVSGVGGWVVPGDRISVFQASHLLFPNVEVLAVDRNRLGTKPPKPAPDGEIDSADGPENSASVLTVRMNPIEAAALIEARNRSSLSVLLRAMGDDLEEASHGK